MIVSLNEMEVTVRNAALGVGVPIGVAEEAGAAAGWLTLRGLPAVPRIRDALQRLESGESAPPQFRREDKGGWTAVAQPCASAVYAGPASCDLLLSRAGDPVVRLGVTDERLLVAASAAIAALRFGVTIVVSWADGGAPVRFRFQGGHTATFAADLGVFSTPGPLTLALASTGGTHAEPRPSDAVRLLEFPADPSRVLENGIRVDDEDWAALRSLAARMLVPASERSRLSGAGAGFIDAD